MDTTLRAAERAQSPRATAQALVRAGDQDGAIAVLEQELLRLERETVSTHKAMESRLLNAQAMRAVDDEIPQLLQRVTDLLGEQIAVAGLLRELGYHVPAPKRVG